MFAVITLAEAVAEGLVTNAKLHIFLSGDTVTVGPQTPVAMLPGDLLHFETPSSEVEMINHTDAVLCPVFDATDLL